MFRPAPTVLAATLALGAAVAWAGDRTWHPDLDTGLDTARKSGKPVLVVTAWKSGI